MIADHMAHAHTRRQLLKFNVNWIVQWMDEDFEVRVTCKRRGRKVRLQDLALHSTECKSCSVLKFMTSAIRKACDNFDDYSKGEECLKAVQAAVEIVDGLERLTTHKNWITVS